MTAPERSGPADANTRGIIVIVIAVVIGVALLAKLGSGGGGGSPSAQKSGGATTTSTTTITTQTTPDTSATTLAGSSPTTRPTAQVKVVVLNGSGGKVGIAAKATTALKGKGYSTLPAGSATAIATTTVYYAPNYQADAVAVAAALGHDATAAQPLPSSGVPGGSGTAGANVVVVLGKDTPAA